MDRGTSNTAHRRSARSRGSSRLRRALQLERLEPRRPLAGQNPFNPYDVDDNGLVDPRDVLLVANELNAIPAETPDGSFWDVNGDDVTAPIDALLILNHLANHGESPVPLVFNLAPADDPNGNGVVLKASVRLQGQTLPNSHVRLSVNGGPAQLATADAAGNFHFDAMLPAGPSVARVTARDPHFRGTAAERTLRLGDVVLDWNAALLNVVRDWTALSDDPYPNRIVTSQPPLVARNLAMVHVAMFDAIEGIFKSHERYAMEADAPEGASPIAAAAAAAHRVASQLYTDADERAVFDATLSESLFTVSDPVARAAGVAYGEQVADAMLARRAQDGAKRAVNYAPGTDPGDWQRTYPDYYPPLLPQWPQVTPFAMPDPAAFRVPPPPPLTSEAYAAAVQEVSRLGGFLSLVRTPEQTEIAQFWADGGGTFTPPGHWNQIAADVALARGESLERNARTMALLNIALADAGIASWDAKYAYELWRPIDAIRRADQDGNSATVADPGWIPLLRTPPFPSYTSGHSTFSGAADAVLTALFGDEVPFQSEADGHHGFTQRPLHGEAVKVRSFGSFREAADEAGHSRIYGGIHFAFDHEQGIAAGRAIGQMVVQQQLSPRR